MSDICLYACYRSFAKAYERFADCFISRLSRGRLHAMRPLAQKCSEASNVPGEPKNKATLHFAQYLKKTTKDIFTILKLIYVYKIGT